MGRLTYAGPMKRLLCLSLLFLLRPTAATACSCLEATLQRAILPTDGATHFPVDGQIRVFLTGGFPAALRVRLAEEYRLSGPDGPVPLTASVVRTRLDLKPQTALRPHARYVLESVFAYDANGRRLSDEARMSRRGAEVTQKRYWFPVVAFETGTESGDKPMADPRAGIAVDHRRGGGDCGPGSAISATWPQAAGGPFELVELEVEGLGVVATAGSGRPVGDGAVSLGAGNLLCDPDPIEVGYAATYRARVVAVGPSGLRSPAPWVAVTAARRGPSRPNAGALEGGAVPAAWFGEPAEPGPAPAPTGPAACPNGLERAWVAEADPNWNPVSYEAWLAVGAREADPKGSDLQALLVGQVGETAQWMAIGPNSRQVVPLTGGVEAVAFQGVEAAVLERSGTGDATVFAGLRLDGAGQLRWRQPLVDHHLNWHGRVAFCGERVAFAWDQVVGQAFGDARLRWVVLDAADGHVVGQATDADAPERGFGEGLGLGCMGDGFLLVAGRPLRGVPTALRLTREGTAQPLTLPDLGATTFDVAPWGGGAALALGLHQGGVAVRFLSADGTISPPTELSRVPADRKPVITAGPLGLAVAWETWPGDRAQATVLDTQGHVAEPLVLGAGAVRRTTGITATSQGFLAVTARATGVEVEALRCRATPPLGAPTHLVVP